jgi:Flp pilus assembly protein TadB
VDPTSKLKAVEVLGVLLAGGAFAWWQFRDLKREQEKSRQQREQEAAQRDAPAAAQRDAPAASKTRKSEDSAP